MSDRLVTHSPIDGKVLVERRPLATSADMSAARIPSVRPSPLDAPGERRPARGARESSFRRPWTRFVAKRDVTRGRAHAPDGRPISQSPGEIRGFEDRARYAIGIAEDALRDVDDAWSEGRFSIASFVGSRSASCSRSHLGNVSVPDGGELRWCRLFWPAMRCFLRHSPQTPLCSERIGEAFRRSWIAGRRVSIPAPRATKTRIKSRRDAWRGLRRVHGVGSRRAPRAAVRVGALHIGVGPWSLGGKDPAYVRADVKFSRPRRRESRRRRRSSTAANPAAASSVIHCSREPLTLIRSSRASSRSRNSTGSATRSTLS